MLCRGLFFLTFISTVTAFDGGDAAALVLGVLIAVMGICACFGCISKRRTILIQQGSA